MMVYIPFGEETVDIVVETDTREAKYFDSETDSDEFVTDTEAATGSGSADDDSEASLLIKFKKTQKK